MAIKEIELLKELDTTKQLTFAYLTCERLFPNYVYFSNNFDFGDPHILRDAIDYLYQNIFEIKTDYHKIELLINEVEKNTPDTEDFTTHFVSSALDACTTICDSLDFMVDKDFTRIETISLYATDTISMYIQEIENLNFIIDKEFQKKIDNHPFMQKELSIQIGIIAFLRNRKVIDFDDIHTLLQLQDNKGSLGLLS